MKKYLLIFAVLGMTGCDSLKNQATCYWFLQPGVQQDVCQAILPVFNKHGLTDVAKIQDYVNFVKNDLPQNKYKYGIMMLTGTATGQTKTYLDTTKDSVMAISDLASKQDDPLKFTTDTYKNALELGKIFK
ncbi:MAG: hypothetical protein JXR30_00880 [Alphaproteobacteria bacterium]|nr:hypothetical protein [Alphaproteobacteria bacterium]